MNKTFEALKQGAFYADDWVIIRNEDCRDALPLMPPCDAVITDPPYSDHTHNMAKTNKGKGHGNKLVKFDSISPEELTAIFAAFHTFCERWVIATIDYHHALYLENEPPSGLRFVRLGSWQKTDPMPQISGDRPAQGWEAIAYLHHAGNRMWWNGGGKHGNYVTGVERGAHPTRKPQAMLVPMVENFTNPGALIVDPFGGEGSTAVAAKATGRRCIIIEKDIRWCQHAADRVSQTFVLPQAPPMEQPPLF